MEPVLAFAVDRLYAVERELNSLCQSEFPYKSSELFAKELLDSTRQLIARLESPKNPMKGTKATLAAQTTIKYLSLIIPHMGIILRSSNARNAFELYAPLQEMATALMRAAKDDAPPMVVLSSEWDYSPIYYPTTHYHTGYVLLGIPAPESSNPLILPLAGHEMGHACWLRLGLRAEFEEALKRALYPILLDNWDTLTLVYHELAKRSKPELTELLKDISFAGEVEEVFEAAWNQAEEAFCDILATRIFGSTYIKAFAYLLSSALREQAGKLYPGSRLRLELMAMTCNELKVSLDSPYMLAFPGLQYNLQATFKKGYVAKESLNKVLDTEGSLAFVYCVAESAVAAIASDLFKRADELVTNAGLAPAKEKVVSQTRKWFANQVPSPGPCSLSEVMEAAWLEYEAYRSTRDKALASVKSRKQTNKVQADYLERMRTLKEVVLKTLEVREVHAMLSDGKIEDDVWTS